MKKTLVIDQQRLKEVIANLAPAAKSSKLLAALECVLVNVKKAKASFTATDLNVTIQCNVTVTCEEEFDALIPYHMLKDVTAIAAGNIAIVMEEKCIKLVHANDEIKLPLLDVSEFPKVPSIPKKNTVKLGKEFSEALQMASLTVSKDEGKNPVFTLVCLDLFKNKLNIVSSDTFCIYKQTLEAEHELEQQILLPPIACSSIKGVEVTLSFNDKHAAFESNAMTVIVLRGEGKYAPYDKVIGKPTYNLHLKHADLTAALHLCALSNNKDRETSISPEAKEVTLNSDFQDKGSYARTSITAEYTGDVKSISVNCDQMLRSLKQIGAGEDLELSVVDPTKFITIRRKGDDSTQCVVMPIQPSK